MQNVTLHFTDANKIKLENAFSEIWEIPLVNNGTEQNPQWEPKFTKKKWFKKKIKKWIIKKYAKHQQKKQKDAIIYEEDNTLVESNY